MPVLKILRSFISSFPTATVLYTLLVLLTELNLDFGWLAFAVFMDVIDELIGKAL